MTAWACFEGKRISIRVCDKKRKHLVEPVFGWIKAGLGFRQFLLRGVDSVNAEWELICSATNLRRMAGRLRWP